MSEVFEFDRYHDGVLMAEGARVTAASMEEAIAKARRLFHEPDCRNDEFRLRVQGEAQKGKAMIDRTLSSYAFNTYGNDAKLYNGIHDLETRLHSARENLQQIMLLYPICQPRKGQRTR